MSKKTSYKKNTKDWSDPSVISGSLRKIGYQKYADYLKSKHWYNVRKEYKNSNRSNVCLCGSKDKLQLHHLTYERLGKERLDDLILLCRYCHKEIHKGTRNIYNIFIRRSDEILNTEIDIALYYDRD